MRRADAHLHLFAGGYPGRYRRSPAGGDELAVYQSLRQAHDIGAALVVGYEGGAEFAGNNAYLARLAAEHEWIAPLAYVPPGGPIPDLEGFAGLAVYLADAAAARSCSAWLPDVAGAVVSLNATPAATAHLGPALAALTGCTVLFSHLGLPGPHAGPEALAPLLGLAALPHVGVKVSGLYAVSDPPHDYPHRTAGPLVEALLERFGPERLYWGSDFPPSLDHVSFAQTLDPAGLDGLSPADRAAVLGGNLRRVLQSQAGEVGDDAGALGLVHPPDHP
jgi:L-fucono-1,5-lactonase